jgi:hypothetical protein
MTATTHSIEKQPAEQTRGRKRGSKNTTRPLPVVIHPEQRLTIKEMAVLSGKSESFYQTNLSLAHTGRKHTPLPPIVKVGRNRLCRAADFFAWLNGETSEAA